MKETKQKPANCSRVPQRDERVMHFSANRGNARHRVRYVEGNRTSQNCTVCDLADGS